MPMKSLFIAIQFLTIIPFGKKLKIEEGDFARSMVFFPVVGLIIGMFLVLINYLALIFLSSFVINVLIIITWVILTGALHLDGFADTVDGLWGGQSKEERLKIMKDSFIGAKGGVALFCLLALKFALLMEIIPHYKYQTLLFTPVMGRWAMVVGIFLAPYAKEEGMAMPFVEHKDKRHLLWASLIALIIGLFLFKFVSLGIMGLTFFVTFILTSYLKRRIGGITGDTLGALEEIIEVFILLVICLFSS